MGLGPEMRGSHKGQEDREVLYLRIAQRAHQRAEAAGRIWRLEEYVRRAGKERPFHRRVRVWQLKQCRLTAFTLCERWLQTFTAQQRTTDQVKNFVDALHGAGGIAGGSSQSDKEPNVARDAIAQFHE